MDYINNTVEQAYSVETIRQAHQANQVQSYILFWGHQPSIDGSITKSALSQWWQSDFKVDGHTYTCMEQFMMAGKARVFGDSETLSEILACRDPERIKALGRKVRNFDRALWDKHKFTIVCYGNYCKFSQNAALKAYLLSTKDSIIAEASPYDCIWGIGMSADEAGADDPMRWKGQNLLGCALMQVRDTLLSKNRDSEAEHEAGN